MLGRRSLPLNASASKANGLLVFNESAGIPFVFSLIQHWERRLRRFGVKKEFSRALAVFSVMSLPLVLLVIRQWPYRPLSVFWAVWLAMCDSLIILLSWRSWNAFLETRLAVTDMLEDAPDN